jgi:hypothetical protein
LRLGISSRVIRYGPQQTKGLLGTAAPARHARHR